MIDQKLATYIRQQRTSGYDIQSIRTTLLQQGWDRVTVDETINSITKKAGGRKMVDMKNPHYSGFWIRVVAAILDGLIIGIPVGALGWGLAFATGVASMSYVAQLASLVLIIYLDGMKGGTPGKLILGMRIVNEQGNFIGIPGAILRYVGKILSGIILGIGYLMIGFSEKKQGLHDKLAKTFVVKV